MGKKARIKKQERLNQHSQERSLIEARRREARQPTVRLIRRIVWAVFLTLVLLYVGQIVDQRIASAQNNSEVSQ